MLTRTFPLFALFLMTGAANAQNLFIGDARALSLLDERGQALSGSFSNPQWETRGDGLFFIRENAGIRNLWRASPAPNANGRYAPWRASPLTDSPFFTLENAVPLDGDAALIAVGNVFSPSENPSQLLRFDLKKRAWTKIALDAGRALEIAPSRDGKWLVFSRFLASKLGEWQICALPLDNAQTSVEKTKVLRDDARRPLWLDRSTLLYQSVAPRSSGLFRATLDGVSLPQLVLNGAGDATALFEGQFLVLSAQKSSANASQLYLLARDGSGLRALNAPPDARHPVAKNDGQWLAFDAPLPGHKARALWVMPARAPQNDDLPVEAAKIVKSRPSTQITLMARLSRVQIDDKGRLEIRGFYDLGTEAKENQIELEIGVGSAPTNWQKIPLKIKNRVRTPENSLLALWRAPSALSGRYAVRLTVNSPAGAAQSQMDFVGATPAPNSLKLPPIPIPARAQKLDFSARNGAQAQFRLIQEDTLGGPYLPPPATFPTPVAVPTPTPTAIPTATPRPPVVPDSDSDSDSNPTPTPTPAPNGDANAPVLPVDGANINVAGTLSELAANGTMRVAFWGQNTGNRPWTPQDVRVVARWVDFSTGTRRKWQYKWMKSVVAPGEQTRFEFDLGAPARAGRYKLIYGIVRLNAPNAPFEAPPYSAAQESWPGEFAAIAFAVNVAPANSLPKP